MPSPMPGKFHQFVAVPASSSIGFGQAAEKFRGAFVAAVAADHGAVDFEQLRRFPQDARDLTIFHVCVQRAYFESEFGLM